MEDKKYVKMSELVDKDITIKRVGNYKFVAWDPAESKYKTDDKWFQGAQKKYPIDTDIGTVDMSANHVGSMFEGVQHAGQSTIIGATFHVKSNGKTGVDIRYFINPSRVAKAQDPTYDESGAPNEPSW